MKRTGIKGIPAEHRTRASPAESADCLETNACSITNPPYQLFLIGFRINGLGVSGILTLGNGPECGTATARM
jgi:hypothetical protein